MSSNNSKQVTFSTGSGKHGGWMFHGYIFFVLYDSPRVEKEVSIEIVSGCFSGGDETLLDKKKEQP